MTNSDTIEGTAPATDRSHDAVVLFDGVCNLCNGWVNFVIDRDPAGYFSFGALQGDAAQVLMKNVGVDREMNTIILIEDGEVFEKSEAVLRIASKLQGLWNWLSIFRIVPRSLRDVVYDLVARNRYDWFGKRDSCRLPTPDLKARFID